MKYRKGSRTGAYLACGLDAVGERTNEGLLAAKAGDIVEGALLDSSVSHRINLFP
jgi:hypothetical protein